MARVSRISHVASHVAPWDERSATFPESLFLGKHSGMQNGLTDGMPREVDEGWMHHLTGCRPTHGSFAPWKG